jgi:hypothetical protein
MTEYIGDIPISSVQEVIFTKAQENEEIDIIDDDSNFILSGNDEGEEVEINFTLLKQAHPERLEIENQRDELKGLASSDASQNNFQYNGTEYFLSIGEVSIPESSELQTIREGTISAKAFPWPKNFEEVEVGVDKRNSGIIDLEFNLESDPIRSRSIEDEIVYSMAVESFANIFHSSQSVIDYSLETDGISNYLLSVDSEIIYSLSVDSDSSLLFSVDSKIEYDYSTVASGSILVSLIEELLFDLSIEADVDSYPIFDSDINYVFGVDGMSNRLFSVDSTVMYNLNSEVVPDMKYSSVGILGSVLSSEGFVDCLRSSETNVSYSLDMNGAVEKEYSGFGRYFGRTFGS